MISQEGFKARVSEEKGTKEVGWTEVCRQNITFLAVVKFFWVSCRWDNFNGFLLVTFAIDYRNVIFIFSIHLTSAGHSSQGWYNRWAISLWWCSIDWSRNSWDEVNWLYFNCVCNLSKWCSNVPICKHLVKNYSSLISDTCILQLFLSVLSNWYQFLPPLFYMKPFC